MRSFTNQKQLTYAAVSVLLLGLLGGLVWTNAHSRRATVQNTQVLSSHQSEMEVNHETTTTTPQKTVSTTVQTSDNCTNRTTTENSSTSDSKNQKTTTTVRCDDSSGATNVQLHEDSVQEASSEDVENGTSAGASAHNESNTTITIH